jgi:DNA-directed RNA polymerase specialized sigma24 family protein
MQNKLDRDLVVRLQINDTDALKDIYDKYHKVVYINALILTVSEVNALAVVEEVFSLIWGKRHLVNPDQHLAGWLFVICFDVSMKKLRPKFMDAPKNDIAEQTAIENASFEYYQKQYALMMSAEQRLLQKNSGFSTDKKPQQLEKAAYIKIYS